MWEVMHRQKDIQYSSRVASHIARQLQTHRLRHVIKELLGHIPENVRNSEAVRELAGYGCLTRMHVVRLLAPRLDNEDHTKDVDFSPSGIRQRWEAGYASTQRAIEQAPWEGEFDPLEGVILHEPRADDEDRAGRQRSEPRSEARARTTSPRRAEEAPCPNSTPSSSAPARPARRWPHRLARRGHEGRHRRAPPLRRHLRQHRLHADQDAGRQRLRRAPGAARRRVRRGGRRRRQRRHEAGEGAQGRTCSASPTRGVERWLRSNANDHRLSGPCALRRRPHEVAVGERDARRAAGSSSTSAAAPSCPTCPGSTRSPTSPTAR